MKFLFLLDSLLTFIQSYFTENTSFLYSLHFYFKASLPRCFFYWRNKMPRGNIKNLKTPTSEEARKNGKSGGIASGKARAEKKTLREELLLLLQQDNNNTKVSVALLNEALKGNVKAFEVIRDTIGEKPVDEVNLNTIEVRIDDADN